MRLLIIVMVSILGAAATFGALSEDQMKDLKRYMRITSVRDEITRDDDRNKVEVLKFFTTQDERDTENYCISVTVEMKDREGSFYYVQLMRQQQVVSGYDYAGQDRWEVRIPHGDLDRPRTSAYVIEYGKMDGDTFVPIAVETDGVKSVEEIVDRGQDLGEDKASLWHAFSYRDPGAGQDQNESILRKLKQ